MSTKSVIQRALISTADKTGLVDLAKNLSELGIEILATSGTAKLFLDHHLPITEVSDYTGFPEILGGRVKTLHPKIFGGLLARGHDDEDVLKTHAIDTIQLLIVNLYPFQETIARIDCTMEQAIEQIDIGGVALLRAAAKNYQYVTVLVDPNDYSVVIQEIEESGSTSLMTRRRLAQKAFAYTAHYDACIANYLRDTDLTFPDYFTLSFHKQADLRYGENPQQRAAWYQQTPPLPVSISAAEQIHGKQLSYNNLLDADTAWQCVKNLDPKLAACVIVKHATPCGAAYGKSLVTAYQQAYLTDPSSAFGGIIAFNQPLDEATVQTVLNQQFVEILIAPAIEPGAKNLLQNKPNVRVLITGKNSAHNIPAWDIRSISGGLLIQESDFDTQTLTNLHYVTERHPSEDQLNDLLFAWKIVQYVKSNAIVLVKEARTLGIGAGQTSRVFSTEIAALKAHQNQLPLQGSVLASDAFFPFADSIELAATYGVTAIIQPGGSKQDAEVIAAANRLNIAMVLTGVRHFRH